MPKLMAKAKACGKRVVKVSGVMKRDAIMAVSVSIHTMKWLGPRCVVRVLVGEAPLSVVGAGAISALEAGGTLAKYIESADISVPTQ